MTTEEKYGEENPCSDNLRPILWIGSILFCMIFWFFVFAIGLAHADKIPEDVAVQCILGEARGESKLGMIAVAEAIRNRGHLKGVYGCDSKFKVKKSTRSLAKLAWRVSKNTNVVKLGDHWHSTDEPIVWWEKYGELTVIIGKHKFYKNVYK